MTPRKSAVLVIAGIMLLTAAGDQLARRIHLRAVEQEINAGADLLAEEIVTVVEEAAVSVDILAAFAGIAVQAGGTSLTGAFTPFADVLLHQHPAIRSVQLGPGSILEYVYPVEGNEAALGLDLLADPDRRALLEPSIATGEMTFQGPVELVQGGIGLIVRRPVYLDDGSFWGFAALVLDWEVLFAQTRLESDGSLVSAVQVPNLGVAAGDPAAFTGNPVTRILRIRDNDEDWTLACRPAGGWPGTAPTTSVLWLAGIMLSIVGGAFTLSVTRRPAQLRREVAAALSELAISEARFQAIFEHAGTGIVTSDPAGRIISANPMFCSIVGVADPSEVEGTRAFGFVHPDDRHLLAQLLREMEGSVPTAVELRVGSRDCYRWCRARITVMPDQAGRPDLVVSLVTDITERRSTEEALAASERRYRELFDSVPIAIQREDHSRAVAYVAELREGGVDDLRAYLREEEVALRKLLALVEIRAVNPSARLFQAPLSRADTQLSLLDVYSLASRDGMIEVVSQMAEGITDGESVIWAEGADGVERALHVHWHLPMKQHSPMFDSLLVTISDVTALRRAEERLQRLVEAKDRFVASVAHELRTPLTSVFGFARTLVDAGAGLPEEDLAELYQLVAFHAEEMSYLIEDLLVSGRSDVSEVRIRIEPIDLTDLAESVVDGIPSLHLVVEAPDGPVAAMGDPIRVRQILRNLVTNALRYGGDDIRVAVRLQGGAPAIEVSDDGPPLSREESERIFEPYEMSPAELAQPGSIGLGLTVSRSLAHLLGGELVLERVAGRNVFRFSLPPAEEQPPTPA